jgi:inner membrane protein involved in colicin E2 resistance
MFEGWDSFYLMVGGAAGALIGLMFVVATLGAGRSREESLRGASIFMTPTVVSFTVVLVVSALTAVPRLAPLPAAAALGAIAAGGVVYAAFNAWRLTHGKVPHWSDYWCYGFGPIVFYAGLGGAAAAVGFGATWAAQAVAAALLAQLLLAIRNAWDLVTWLAPGAASGDGA